MKDFFVAARWQMKIPDGLQGVAGGVIMPSGISLHSLGKRDMAKSYPHLARRLLDPQLYLAELNAASCRKTCANLASYGWFSLTEQFPFNSSEQKQSEWRKDVAARIETAWTGQVPSDGKAIDDTLRIALSYQQKVGVESFIIPSPLTQDINSSFDVELEWLERGISVARTLAPDVPVNVSIAISDVALRGLDPWKNPLVDTILDQLTSRGIKGVYLVPVMSSEDSYYYTHPNTVGALLRLCNGFQAGGAKRILISFAGVAGLLCLAAGATGWVSGWHRSERRMRLSDFELEGGRVVPSYYSSKLAGEFHLEHDLDRVVEAGFLTRIGDSTPASAGLIKALTAGKAVASVPEWRHQRGNKRASIEHFLTACARDTDQVAGLNGEQLLAKLNAWISSAYVLASDLQRVGAFNPRTSLHHQYGWKVALESMIQNRY